MLILGNKFIHGFASLGFLIQKGMFSQTFENSYVGSYVIIMLVFEVFYFGAIICSFYAYREFKAMMFDNGMGSQGGIASLMAPCMSGIMG